MTSEFDCKLLKQYYMKLIIHSNEKRDGDVDGVHGRSEERHPAIPSAAVRRIDRIHIIILLIIAHLIHHHCLPVSSGSQVELDFY